MEIVFIKTEDERVFAHLDPYGFIEKVAEWTICRYVDIFIGSVWMYNYEIKTQL